VQVKIYSLVAKRVEDVPPGAFPTGAVRFDSMLRRVFPDLVSITPAQLPKKFEPDAVVIADNHLSLLVPIDIRTLVVHHGCGATHYERDPYWRTNLTKSIVSKQMEMTYLPNRRWIAPSRWAVDEFSRSIPDWMREVRVIPHWVETINLRVSSPPEGKPRIIGDWRDFNKGSEVWRNLQHRFPQWEFQPLNFQDDEGRRKQYGEAALYLCLSLSEGGSYSMCDAEAAGIPIVTTDVGNYHEFRESDVIPWGRRDDAEFVGAAIARKLASGRGYSYYETYLLQDWVDAWEEAVA
jgi:glycosyltransferase involved in cell wall biosynthesis